MDTRYLLYRNVHPLQFVHLLVFCPLLPRQRAPPHIFSGEKKKRSSRSKQYMEDQGLSEANLTRAYLNSLICKKEHPQSKYIYMPSEECTKKRSINTDIGFLICSTSTLMWSPFSPACQICTNVEKCKKETAIKYPELYRIRLEEYGERR